jgi:hypothetical protein
MTVPAMSRTIITWLCVISLLFQAGCAHQAPPPVTYVLPNHLGTVGIVPAHYRTRADLDLPAKGWLGGAGRKSVRWMGKGALVPLAIAEGCSGDETGFCGLLILALSVTAGTVGGLAGGVAGAIEAEPAQKVALDEEVINSVIAGLKMQESLCDRVVQLNQCAGCNDIVRLPDQLAAVPGETISYGALAAEGIDTVMEIAIPRFALSGEWDTNPPLQFQLDSHLRLMRTADERKVYESSFEYRGSSMTFSLWADDDAREFFRELDKAVQSLAQKIGSDVLERRSTPEPDEDERPDD